MASQTQSGLSFEFAIFSEIISQLNTHRIIHIIAEDNPYTTAKSHFDSLSETEKEKRLKAAKAGVEYLFCIEPKLKYSKDHSDQLFIALQSSDSGKRGDPRDIILRRKTQNWEIGISAKNNHHDLKHSRLSPKIDFGKEWCDTPVSESYWISIKPIFETIATQRSTHKTWEAWGFSRDIKTNDQLFIIRNTEFVIPLLTAFEKELIQLCNKPEFPPRFVQYLIGFHDFHQLIHDSSRKSIEIIGWNLSGNLSQSSPRSNSIVKINKLSLPERLLGTSIKNTSLEISFDHGWTFSFRLHTASNKVENSLKFAVSLVGVPFS